MARLCSPQDYLFFSWDVQSYRTFAATCCYRRLNVIERANTHTSLAFFRDEPTIRRFCTHCGPIFLFVTRGPQGVVKDEKRKGHRGVTLKFPSKNSCVAISDVTTLALSNAQYFGLWMECRVRVNHTRPVTLIYNWHQSLSVHD